MPENKKVGAGFGVILFKDGKVLLGHRHEDPVKADSALNGAGTWTLPGGKLDFGESFEAGAAREVMEETGIEVKKVKVFCVNNDMVPTAHFVTLGMQALEWAGEPKVMEPDEITQWEWFNLDHLPSPMYPPSVKTLRNFRENKFYISS
jgi:8-oxo-dGTP diphosphatase